MNPSTAVLIPNYNGRELLARYLPSVLAAAERAGATVWVADDASPDGSGEWARENFPAARVLVGPANLGFAGNVNRAVRAIDAEVIILLNSDVEAEPDFIAPLLEVLADPEVFAVVPRVLEQDRDHSDNFLRFRRGVIDFVFPSQDLGQSSPDSVTPVGYGIGAALAFTKNKFLELGGFDELFSPFYGEDLDLSYRAWKNGWRVLYQAGSTVRHQHAGTIGRMRDANGVRQLKARQTMLFQWKNLSDPGFVLRHAAWLPLRLLAYALYPARWPELRGMVSAFPLLYRTFRARVRPRVTDAEVIVRAGRSGRQ